MPRHARIDAPRLLQHIMVRGINGSPIFLKNSDYQYFLESLSMAMEEPNDAECYAWALMDNHVHLLVKVGHVDSMAKMMRSMLTRYAGYFNATNNRSGYVFQNRYKSIVCDGDEYFMQLVRYIHLNPVKAKMIGIKELDNYPYTGHKCLIGKDKYKWQERQKVLSYFGEEEKEAVEQYKEFVEGGVDNKEDYEGGGLIRSKGGKKGLQGRPGKKRKIDAYDARILGSSSFVQKVIENYIPEKERMKDVCRELEEILKEVSEQFNVSEEELRSKSKEGKICEARAAMVYELVRKEGYRVKEVSEWLGLSTGATSRLVRRGGCF